MGYKKKIRSSTRNTSFFLNITSMTDMFTILLVFLLQTYSTADFKVEPEKDISLPLSGSELNPTKSLKVSVSPNELRVNETVIAQLDGGKFKAADLEKTDKSFITTLATELKKHSEENLEGKLLLLADSSLSYETLKQVMYTSSMAGFPNMKLATVVGK